MHGVPHPSGEQFELTHGDQRAVVVERGAAAGRRAVDPDRSLRHDRGRATAVADARDVAPGLVTAAAWCWRLPVVGAAGAAGAVGTDPIVYRNRR